MTNPPGPDPRGSSFVSSYQCMNPLGVSAAPDGAGLRSTIRYAPPSNAAINSDIVIQLWVRRVMACRSSQLYSAGLPLRMVHTAGADWKFPLPGARVIGPAVP